MNIHDLPDYIVRAKAMTVGELRKILERMPSKAKVYINIDKVTDDAWDGDNERWRYAIPLAEVRKESLPLDADNGMETNVLLEYADP